MSHRYNNDWQYELEAAFGIRNELEARNKASETYKFYFIKNNSTKHLAAVKKYKNKTHLQPSALDILHPIYCRKYISNNIGGISK